MKTRNLQMTLAMAVAVAVLVPAYAGADGSAVELIHPQSDDQGNYAALAMGPRVTVIGLVSPATGIESVAVNGKPAQLFDAQLAPFGADSSLNSIEFRATVLTKGKQRLQVRVNRADGTVEKTMFTCDTDATTARLRELSDADADDVRMRCRLGGCLKDQGKTEEAVEVLRKLVNQGDACVNTRVTIGKALVSMGLPEEGMREFTLATEMAPDYAMAWLNLGLVQARFTRNTDAAVRCFRKYLALEPNSSIADKVERFIEMVEG